MDKWWVFVPNIIEALCIANVAAAIYCTHCYFLLNTWLPPLKSWEINALLWNTMLVTFRQQRSTMQSFTLNVWEVLFRLWLCLLGEMKTRPLTFFYKSPACFNYLYWASMTISSLLKWMRGRNRQEGFRSRRFSGYTPPANSWHSCTVHQSTKLIREKMSVSYAALLLKQLIIGTGSLTTLGNR